jgi:hypothetical protein
VSFDFAFKEFVLWPVGLSSVFEGAFAEYSCPKQGFEVAIGEVDFYFFEEIGRALLDLDLWDVENLNIANKRFMAADGADDLAFGAVWREFL